jgi:5-methylcytosine-specific restriction endonuclease McrA
MTSKPNPRTANGSRRRGIRKWVLATQDHCALCGLPVDKSLKTPHPMSAEVDEIVPVSRGGSPTNRNNVQLTHRVCNQRKGARMLGDRPKQTSMPLRNSRQWFE